MKSGSTTQRGAAVGSVGMTTFCRSRSTLREAFSNRARNRSQSGVAVEQLDAHDPRAGARIGLTAVQQLVDRTQFLGKSGRVQLRHVAHRLSLSSVVAECWFHASPLAVAAKDLLVAAFDGDTGDAIG